MKTFLKRLWTIIKKTFVFIGGIFIAIYTVLFIKSNKKTNEIKDDAEKKQEEKKNELEKKSANDIAADSPNSDTISSNIEREQKELRQRLRNRFNKNIQGQRSTTDN